MRPHQRSMILFTALAAGCGPAVSSGASPLLTSSAVNGHSLYQIYHQVSAQPDYQQALKAWGSLSFDQLRQVLTTAVSDQAVTVDGLTFRGERTQLAQNNQGLDHLQQRYGSLTAYWRALDVDPTVAVSWDDFRMGLTLLQSLSRGHQTPASMGLSPAQLRLAELSRLVILAFTPPPSVRAGPSLALTIVVAGDTSGPSPGGTAITANHATCTTNTASSMYGPDGLLKTTPWAGDKGISSARWKTSDVTFIQCVSNLVANWPNVIWDPSGTRYTGDGTAATKLAAQGQPDVYNISIGDAYSSDCRPARNNNETCYENMKFDGYTPTQN